MPDFTRRHIYSFEAQGVDRLESDIRRVEQGISSLNAAAGALNLSGIFSGGTAELQALNQQLREAATNMQRLGQAGVGGAGRAGATASTAGWYDPGLATRMSQQVQISHMQRQRDLEAAFRSQPASAFVPPAEVNSIARRQRLADTLDRYPRIQQSMRAEALGLEDFNKQLERGERAGSRFGRMLGIVARAWVAWRIVDGVASSVKRWVDVQVDINDRMVDFQINTRASAEAAQEYLQVAERISQITGVRPAEAAETLAVVRRVGMPDLIAQRAAEVQRVTGLDSTEVARELISLQRQFPEQDITTTLDQIVGAFQRSTVSTLKEFFGLLDVAGPTAGKLGTDSGGIFGLLAGATTVTSLQPGQIELGIRRISAEYSDATSDFSKALQTLGVATKDSEGNLRDFVEIITELGAGLQSGRFSEEDIEALGTNIPNVLGTAFGEMFQQMVSGSEQVKQAVDSSRDSQDQLARAVELAGEKISTGAKEVGSAFDRLALSMDASSGIVTFLNALADSLDRLRERIETNKAIVTDLVDAYGPPEGSALARWLQGRMGGGLFGTDEIFQGTIDDVNRRVPGGGPEYTRLRIAQMQAPDQASMVPFSYAQPTERLQPREQDFTEALAQAMARGVQSLGKFFQVDQLGDVGGILERERDIRSQLEGRFGAAQVEEAFPREAITFVDELGNVSITTSSNLDILGFAARDAASELNFLAGNIVQLPEGVGFGQFQSAYGQTFQQLMAAGAINPQAAQSELTFFRDQYGNILNPGGTDVVPDLLNITNDVLRQQQADAKLAARESERIAREQMAELRGIRSGISSFVSSLGTPTPVTEGQFALSAVGLYEDQFDEVIRRARDNVQQRAGGKSIVYPDADAFAAQFGFDIAGGSKDLQAARLEQLEQAFYNFRLPTEAYDVGLAADQFIQGEQDKLSKERFVDALLAELAGRAEAGELPEGIDLDPNKLRAAMGLGQTDFTQQLFGGASPKELGEELQPYGQEIQKQLNAGMKEASGGYVSMVAETIGIEVSSDTGKLQLMSAGLKIGVVIREGIGEGMGGIVAMIVAAVIQQLTDMEPAS